MYRSSVSNSCAADESDRTIEDPVNPNLFSSLAKWCNDQHCLHMRSLLLDGFEQWALNRYSIQAQVDMSCSLLDGNGLNRVMGKVWVDLLGKEVMAVPLINQGGNTNLSLVGFGSGWQVEVK